MILSFTALDNNVMVQVESFEKESHAPFNLYLKDNFGSFGVNLSLSEAKRLAKNLQLSIESVEEGISI